MSDTLGVMFSEKMKKTAFAALMQQYIQYLCGKEQNLGRDEIKNKVGGILSAALDRGDIDMVTIDKIMKYIDGCPYKLNAIRVAQSKEQFLNKTLLCGLTDLVETDLPTEDHALFATAKELISKLEETQSKIIAKYGHVSLEMVGDLYHTYQKLYDPGFEQKLNEIIR